MTALAERSRKASVSVAQCLQFDLCPAVTQLAWRAYSSRLLAVPLSDYVLIGDRRHTLKAHMCLGRERKALEDRPILQILAPLDAIVKVSKTKALKGTIDCAGPAQ